MIRRKQCTVLTDTKESTTVLELKSGLSGILKVSQDDMRLWKDGLIMEDGKTLSDSGVTVHNAQAMTPLQLGLAIRTEEGGEFEELAIEQFSVPPELPEALKQQEPAC